MATGDATRAAARVATEALIITCEHASNRVPGRYAARFRRAGRALAGHRGHDIGTAWLARRLARWLDVPLFLGTVTRLLVDLNRSLHHRALFSAYTRDLPAQERARIVDRYYRPYREAVTALVDAHIRAGRRVLHVAVHSFTPRLDGVDRNTDVGLLYDPARAPERALCREWQRALAELDPGLRVRRNHPYRGAADGFTTALRRRFDASTYRGIELEMSQARLGRPGPARQALAKAVLASLRTSLQPAEASPRFAPARHS